MCSYPLLEHAAVDLSKVDDILSQAVALGRPLVRTNAFIVGGTHPGATHHADGSVRDAGLVALDRLVERARAHGVQLVLTTMNNWPDYGGAQAVVDAVCGPTHDKDLFWTDPNAIACHQNFITTLVTRTNTVTGQDYATDSTIYAWELCNEARCKRPWWARNDVLAEWARTMVTTIRDLGTKQPIAWGGSGHRNKYGEDLATIVTDGGVDIATLHLYPHHTHPELNKIDNTQRRTNAAIAAGISVIDDRAALATRLGVPLLIEELGWVQGNTTDDAERAAVMSGWLAHAQSLGVSTLPWMIGESGRPDYDGLLIDAERTPMTWSILRA